MGNVVLIDDERIRLAERPKLMAKLRESKDLEGQKKIERTRTVLLDALRDLVLLEGGKNAVEWAETAIESIKVGMQS